MFDISQVVIAGFQPSTVSTLHQEALALPFTDLGAAVSCFSRAAYQKLHLKTKGWNLKITYT